MQSSGQLKTAISSQITASQLPKTVNGSLVDHQLLVIWSELPAVGNPLPPAVAEAVAVSHKSMNRIL